MLVAVLALSLAANPVPPPRVRPPVALAGKWVACWSESKWPTALLADGTYVCERPGGPRYEGTWRLRRGVLTIVERQAIQGGYGQSCTYSWTLRPGKRASVCGTFRLEAAK